MLVPSCMPIPSMCFAMDHKAQRWLVIDGLQRISTVVRFLEGGDWTLSDLEDIELETSTRFFNDDVFCRYPLSSFEAHFFAVVSHFIHTPRSQRAYINDH